MDISQLSIILQDQPKFRWQQINQALFQQFITSWSELTTLPLSLREKLETACPLSISGEIIKDADKKNNSQKALITLSDGLKIETVLIRQANSRYTVCVSSQVGCPLACSFCSTGKLGFKRNLTKEEIIDQFIFWGRHLKNSNHKIDNLVFMGMGEPLLNYQAVMAAIKFLNNPETTNFGARRISVSTVGLPAMIKKLASENLQINLAISLHAPNDALRQRLMPRAADQASLKDIFKAADFYLQKTGRRLMFEYVMLAGVNDSDIQAKELAKLMAKPLYLLNLIPYNPGRDFKASSPERIKQFYNILLKSKVAVTVRHSQGSEIAAACGQLVAK